MRPILVCAQAMRTEFGRPYGEDLQIGFDWVARTFSGAFVELASVQRALDHVPLKPSIEQPRECVGTDVVRAELLVQLGKLYE